MEDIAPCTSVVEGFTVNWDNLPEWAEWFVIDGGGDCYVYSYKPQIKDGYDYWLYSDEDVSPRSECIGSVNHVKDWKKTLTKRPSL